MTQTGAGEKAATVPAVTWDVCTATARGSAHRDDVPNQDAVACAVVIASAGQQLHVAAVADGHGGRRYVRSAVGSRCAVDLAVDQVRVAVGAAPPRVDLNTLLRQATRELVGRWRAEVLEHTARHPFTSEEAEQAGTQDLSRDPLIAYGATLLVMITRGSEVALAQLGDGDALVRRQGALAARPVPGDDRLIAGETTSLCLPGAEDDFRFASLDPAEDVDLVVLATDGYGNSFASGDWWQTVVADLAVIASESGPAALAERLPGWLSESATVGGDDVTAAVLVRSPMARPAGTSTPTATATATATLLVDPDPTSEPRDRSRLKAKQGRVGRRSMVVAAIAALLVLLAVIAYAVARPSDPVPLAPRPPGGGTAPSSTNGPQQSAPPSSSPAR